MAKLTNCEISYERSKKLADYESQKFAAKFSILLDDGEDPEEVTELYGRQLVRFVHSKLGINSEIEVPNKLSSPGGRGSPPAIAASTTVPQPPPAESIVDAAPPERKKPGRKPKAEEAAPETMTATEAEAARVETVAVVITDKQLSEVIMATTEITKDPTAIRHQVQTYFPAPKGEGAAWASKELPQERRQEFLNWLEAAKAAARAKDDVSAI